MKLSVVFFLFVFFWGLLLIEEYFKWETSGLPLKQYMKKNEITFSDILVFITLWGGLLGFSHQFIYLFWYSIPFFPYFDSSVLVNDSIFIICYFVIMLLIYISLSNYWIYELLKMLFAKISKKSPQKLEKIASIILWFLSFFIVLLLFWLRQKNLKLYIQGDWEYSIYYMNDKYIFYYTGDGVSRENLLIRDKTSDIVKNALFLP